MSRNRMRCLALFALFPLWCGGSGVSSGVPATPQVLTSHWDNTRGNWNPVETVLTPANVTGGHFGHLSNLSISGFVFAQPIFAPGVVTSAGQKDLVIVVTMSNIVYAFDANNFGSAVWSTTVALTRDTYPNTGQLYNQPLGCVATPVVDIAAGKVYALCSTNVPTYVLYVLRLSDGVQLSSVTVTGQVPGTGDPNGGDPLSGGNLVFFPTQMMGRPSLTFANGNVYASFGSVGETRPWHGWVMGYDKTTLSQIGVWCATPNNYGGALWFSGGGPAVDQSGNLYVTTGNGHYDGAASSDFGDSVVKLSPTLAVLDWFTPSNQANLESVDADVSSARIMILPNGKLLLAFKDFNLYMIDPNCMGHLQGSSGCSLQTWVTNSSFGVGASTGTYGGVFGLNTAFLPITNGQIFAFPFANGSFGTTPVTSSSPSFSFPGASQMTLSSNGLIGGVLWIAGTTAGSSFSTPRAGVLYAFNPATLVEYWDSTQNAGDTLGTMAKFSSPLIANGRVFVATNSGYVAVYGMGAH
jgi:hypothetical protein